MAEEDAAREELGKSLLRVNKIPRPKVRAEILLDTMNWCAAALNLKLERKE